MAEPLDFTHDQGSTFTHNLVWQTGSAKPEPVDLSNYTARMHLRTEKTAAEVVLALTTENGRISLGSDGSIDLSIDADTTSGIDAGSYRYDLELVAPDGVVVRLLEGKFKLTQEVTRDEGI